MSGPKTAAKATDRVPLSRQRVLRAAVHIADTRGLDALTMRNLAAELSVEAMSLYYHVANKEEILDGVVEVVVQEINDAARRIEVPAASAWKETLRLRILAARGVLLRHPWAPAVIESRTRMIPPVVEYFEEVLGIMRAGGFGFDLAHHALHALGSRALGFTQELFEPAGDADDQASMAMLEQLADRLPNLVGMLGEIAHDDPGSTLGWCDDQTEFEFGLDLLLDGLEARLDRAPTDTVGSS